MSEGKTVLVVGSGGDTAPQWVDAGYSVVRLDIDPRACPDIVASMVDMGGIGPYDAVYCSHSLEHLYPHEVPTALREFRRVLKPGGHVVILVPDLEGVPATGDALPDSMLCGLHLYYGDATHIADNPHMAHHCGFVASTLRAALEAAGFKARTQRMGGYQLLGIGVK